METTEPVIGYFKVFTGVHGAGDSGEYRSPRPRRRVSTISQWIFPFTESTRDVVKADAERRVSDVLDRLAVPCNVSFSPVHEVPGAYAYRVSRPKSLEQ